MASKICIALFVVLAAIALPSCGGSDDAAPAACQTHPPLPVVKVSYPNDSAPVGANVNVAPSIDVTAGDGLDGAILRFDLIGGTLPSGLSLNPTTGRISGRVAGFPGSFSYTVRVSADCFTGSVTTSAVFFVR
ncbi:Ig domain-containing protein [Noviherbaspirillum saxi]|uniref:Uncharacterized protein n=1 Tax=Noviherbaspirillum saxi TaxID=2320863 RepID=A0A3A3FH87_9BURK|nr:Ig domain-containing protein [Noviherbaspirillum saxi]RJF91864.1 hypothetical protein D3871_24615 [Noviherbaspirillum saxi]